jgi:Protein of unknown function (DUF2997)
MAERIVTVDIDEEGNASSEAAGFKGVGCVKALKLLSDALGKVKSETLKPDYYDSTGSKGTVSAGG